MLGLTLKDRITDTKILRSTGVQNAIKAIITLKWNWAGYVNRMRNNRCIQRIIE